MSQTAAQPPVTTDRDRLLHDLETLSEVDLIVVGGGASGLGVALDARLRGLSVLLLESHDFAGGTSSRATKLVHGGVRYLAQGDIGLVREALRERRALLNNAPHLAQPLAFVMPAYRPWEVPFYGTGLKIYDAVGCPDCTEGYKGRTGIYQVMPMSEEIQAIVLEGGNAMKIAEAAQKSGIRDLRASALLKVKNGITSLAEINRVTKD